MPGMFDDLIPQNAPQPLQAAPQSGGMFDDLIPQAQTQAAPVQQAKPSIGQMFVNDITAIPGNIYHGLKDAFTLPHDVAQGIAQVPQSANMPGGESTQDLGRVLNLATAITPVSEAGGMTRPAPFKAPTEAQLEASKTARYQSPEVLNLRLAPEAGEDLSNIIKTDLKAAKLDQFNGQRYYDIADRLKNPRFGDNITLDDLDAARQDAATAPATATPADKRGSAVIRDAIDNYIGNIPDSHVISGDAAAANDTLLKARQDFGALKRSQDISNALGRAENQAGSTYSGNNLDNATRQQLRPILNQKEGVSKSPAFKDYTPDEIDALRAAVNGSPLGNLARAVGKKLGGGGGIGHSGIGLGTFFGAHELGLDPITSAAVGLGTMGAARGFTALANKMAASGGNYLGDLLRSRSALADEMRMLPQGRQNLSPLWFRAPLLGLGTATPPMPFLGINAATL